MPNTNNWEELRKGYEEVQMVESSIEKAYPEAYRLARKFHELYEEQAPFFGYITNPNTREFYPNSHNARLMAYVCYNIVQEARHEAIAEGIETIMTTKFKWVDLENGDGRYINLEDLLSTLTKLQGDDS